MPGWQAIRQNVSNFPPNRKVDGLQYLGAEMEIGLNAGGAEWDKDRETKKHEVVDALGQ